MKIRFEAPHDHLELNLPKVSRKACEILIPDPVKEVDVSKYPRLKAIVTPSTGTNHIPLGVCEELGIDVLSLLDDRGGLEEIRASSEFAFYMILNALRLGGFRQWKSWDRNPTAMMGQELYKKIVGIVGHGRIGKNVGRWLNAFGARWHYHDPKCKEGGSLEQIFSRSDIVLISCTLNDETEGMIGKELLDKMGEGAILANVARAEIINEDELLNWLRKGRNIYATDVLHREVSGDVNEEFLSLPNCIVTPHIAGHTYESTYKAAQIALKLAGDYEKTGA